MVGFLFLHMFASASLFIYVLGGGGEDSVAKAINQGLLIQDRSYERGYRT